jgi:hypothetical protein
MSYHHKSTVDSRSIWTYELAAKRATVQLIRIVRLTCYAHAVGHTS